MHIDGTKVRIGGLVVTDGRPTLLEQTLHSWEQNGCELDVVVVIDDSSDPVYGARIRSLYEKKRFDIRSSPIKLGFNGAIQEGWSALMGCGLDYVVHIEDDWEFLEPVPIQKMINVLAKNPVLAQLVLKRQPVNAEEIAAGGIIEQWPDQYTERATDGNVWSEHALFFSTNPCIYPAEIINYRWPQTARSEQAFTRQLVAEGFRFAFWGAKTDPPRIHHIGDVRSPTGTGY